MLLYALLLVFIIAPALLGLASLYRDQIALSPEAVTPTNQIQWRLILGSALYCCIAFNLTFFIQEIGLVFPKAFTPGLTPTLYHNDHSWDGEHNLAYLFQGTGALATVASGLISFYLVQSERLKSVGSRLFFLWMAYCGIFMALPQVVIGALNPYNDVGMAMDYFNLTTASKNFLALVAILLMPALAMMLTRPFLSLVAEQVSTSTRGSCSRFIAQIVSLPALLAVVLIIPYRIPREWVEVLILPVIVLFLGTVWIQANAWRLTNTKASSELKPLSLKTAGLWALLLLLIFHITLRPGVTVNIAAAF